MHEIECQLSVCADACALYLGLAYAPYRWSLWLRSCPRPGFGGSDRREVMWQVVTGVILTRIKGNGFGYLGDVIVTSVEDEK
ncbi:unnamed protein product [Penicillium nalgiovense]|uniref:Uncharacterized protein n=1 Tax=Penicillium nalgiovense TaxID=60175 RepID=A0A9W4I470_PENNA|nr:unnamed protein product [Penicillium nalgiovense]CAG7975308.1 unnamed protein product [Penicillium nalgiovense]CAG8016629.1 unnamed protein product [Penicillium nalgiovense]CAG8021883.1 unnamed protein product [Penicillium nalgiovense]CAG8057176.1 unnamed protein product [Penicillium nalgiovense]